MIRLNWNRITPTVWEHDLRAVLPPGHKLWIDEKMGKFRAIYKVPMGDLKKPFNVSPEGHLQFLLDGTHGYFVHSYTTFNRARASARKYLEQHL